MREETGWCKVQRILMNFVEKSYSFYHLFDNLIQIESLNRII